MAKNNIFVRKTIEEEEQEIKDLEDKHREETQENENKAEEGVQDPPEDTSEEEKTWKKRYGDLRTHSQELKKEIQDLKEKIESTPPETNIKAPAKDEDIEAWKKKYPEVSSIIETLAERIADKKLEKANVDLGAIKENQEKLTREKQLKEIYKRHDDFDDIKADEKFHEWAEEQPKSLQDSLYSSTSDAKTIIRIIDLYKIDKGMLTPPKKDNDRDAIKLVRTKERTSVNDKGGVKAFTESQVDRMTPQEYEKNEDAIMEAMRTGNFEYDLTNVK